MLTTLAWAVLTMNALLGAILVGTLLKLLADLRTLQEKGETAARLVARLEIMAGEPIVREDRRPTT